MSNLQVNKLSTKDGSVDIEVKNLLVRDSAMEFLGEYEEGIEIKTVQQYFMKDGDKFVGKAFQLPIVLSGNWDSDKVLVETYGEQWDHSKLYNKDIPNAHDASSIGFRQKGEGAVERTIKDKLEEWVSVKDFGAIGDGQSHPLSEFFSSLTAAQNVYPNAKSLDDELDWAAIQKALDYAAALSDTVIPDKVNTTTSAVYVPPGEYITNSTLVVKEGTRFCGAGKSVSIFKPKHTGVAIQMGGDDREFSNVVVEKIGVIGNFSGNSPHSYGGWTTTTTEGIYAKRCLRGCIIRDTMVVRCRRNYRVDNSYGFHVLENYGMYALENNLRSNNLTASSVRNNRFDWAEHRNLYIENAVLDSNESIGLLIEGNAIQISWEDGVLLYDCQVVDIANNFFEANFRKATSGNHSFADVRIQSGPNNRGMTFTVRNNFFTHGSSPNVKSYTAVRCDRAKVLNVYGNTCRDSWYRRFIDAGNENVERIFSYGNFVSNQIQEIAYHSATAQGIFDRSGTINIPSAFVGGFSVGLSITATSNTKTTALRTLYLLNTESGPKNIILRDIDCVAGRVLIFKKSTDDSNYLQVLRENTGEKTIDGKASIQTYDPYGVIKIVSDGFNWFSI